MKQIVFYLSYAFRNLRRSARWSIFAIFCVAAGVATVVALRSLGLAIQDSLVANVRASNHGDINMSRVIGGFFASNFVTDEDDVVVFDADDRERIDALVAEWGGTWTGFIEQSNFQVTKIGESTAGRPQFASAYFIDPQTFPPGDDIRAVDPAGVPLRDLLTGGDVVVISENLAESNGLAVGDPVRVSGTEDSFTVVGIVATETEASIRNLFAAFFGFAYLDIAQAERLQVSPDPNTIAINLAPGASIDEITDAGARLSRLFRDADVDTVPELLETNAEIGDYIGRFIVVMGLGALLIGGVGIINTMLVMVGRRTSEIAALKTFGLKGRQVVAMFMAEAFLLGVAGSLVGTVFGVLLSDLVNGYGETFLQQNLEWRLYPESLVYGLGLGLVVTLVFGIVPVLTANRVRPAAILRPNETVIPGVGCLHSLLAVLLVVLVIGGAAGQILGVIWVGFIGVAVTLVILGVLVGLYWVLVWLVGKLPAFGWVDLRLALRNLNARRIRTATTLLALSAGMFALSIITFVGAGTREILQFQLSQSFGGNVLVFPSLNLISPEIGQALLRTQVGGIDGVRNVTELSFYAFTVREIDGEPAAFDLPSFVDEDDISPRQRERFGRIELPVTVRSQSTPQTLNRRLSAGRDLTEADRGQPVLLYAPNERFAGQPPIEVGSMLTMEVGDERLTYEVVGILAADQSLGFFADTSIVPPDSVNGARPDVVLTTLDVAPENLNTVLLDLTTLVPPVLALDLAFIDGLIGRFIEQFSAIPTVVGLLSLLAAAVIMANTVSLATLERSRQIGILKAVGLKGRRVLLVMLLENTLVGLLGGLIGIGLSSLAVSLMTTFSTGITIPLPSDATLITVALLVASVVIAWVATFASARVAIGERVANVLRYE
jgi:predicted lysophospholipase L1 biosynthesis ABC-type transport system permease subunit